MSDEDRLARLEELVRDERARRAFAEQQLKHEQEKVEIWRSRAEERGRALRRTPWWRRWRRRPGARPEPAPAAPLPHPAPPSRPELKSVWQPTLRIGVWNAPEWFREAADAVDLTDQSGDIAGVDLVVAGTVGSLPALEDWSTWEARQPLVLWEPSEAGLSEWESRLTGRDLVVGVPDFRGAARALPSFPVASRWALGSGLDAQTWTKVSSTTPFEVVVSRAASGAPQRWSEEGARPDAYADLVAGASAADPTKWALRARLAVQSTHGVGQALDRICEALGLDLPRRQPEMGVLLVTRHPDRLSGAIQRLSHVRYRPLHVVVGLHGFSDDAETHRLIESSMPDCQLTVCTFDTSTSLGQCLNECVEMTSSQLLAKIDDDDWYGPWYFDEAVDELVRSHADLVGKATQFVHLADADQLVLFQAGKENMEVGYVNGPTFVMTRQAWERVRFPHRAARVDSIFVRGLRAVGGSIRSSSRYEFVLSRHGSDHTWQATDDHFLARGEVVGKGSDLSPAWLDA